MVAGKKENPFLNDFGKFDEAPANDPFQVIASLGLLYLLFPFNSGLS